MEEVRALARDLGDGKLSAIAEAAEGAREEAYLALLGPGAPVSPREVAYRGRTDPGRVVGDVVAFYEAFAFHPRTEDPPDHVAVEAGFVGYLHLKEAYAAQQGQAEEAERTAQARRTFVADHLQGLLSGMHERMRTVGVDPGSHLFRTVAFLLELVGGPVPTEPRVEEDGGPVGECGSFPV
jgi:hypothetical protein